MVESVKKGVPNSETAARDASESIALPSSVLQSNSTNAAPSRAQEGSGQEAQELEREKATKLLALRTSKRGRGLLSLRERAEFLFAVSGVRVSEATVCRAVGRLHFRSRKKDLEGQHNERSS